MNAPKDETDFMLRLRAVRRQQEVKPRRDQAGSIGRIAALVSL
jgi:hypothetical protein